LFCHSPSAAAQSFFWFWIAANCIILVTSKKSFHSSKTKDASQNRRYENHLETSPSSWWLPVVAMSFSVSHEAAAQEDAPCLSSTSLPMLSPLSTLEGTLDTQNRKKKKILKEEETL
jgi:hypothetical protein